MKEPIKKQELPVPVTWKPCVEKRRFNFVYGIVGCFAVVMLVVRYIR